MQGKTRQATTIQGNTLPNKIRQDKTRKGNINHDKPRQHKIIQHVQDNPGQSKTSHDKT